MKKLYKTAKYKKHLHKRQLDELKKRRKAKDWLRRKGKNEQGKTQSFIKWRKEVQSSFEIEAPRNFSLSQNINEVLSFITQLKDASKRERKIFIKLKDVEIITHGAIAMLLSVIGELDERKIKVSGDYPKVKHVRKVLDQSGFFNHVKGLIEEENKTTVNTILTKGKEVVESEETAPLVTASMKTIHGQPYRNQPLQGLLVELMANTVNHAFPKAKNRRWWLSVNHDELNNKVSFAFVDNGAGIINTLYLKFKQKIEHLFFSDNAELLNSAFIGKIGSRTRLGNRGRGLPSVYNKYSKKHITRLSVITNDVFLSFDDNKRTKLRNNFDGTYYYWEVDINCTSWKNI